MRSAHLALLLAGTVPLLGAVPPPQAQATADARFVQLGRDYLRDLAALHPVQATELGDHSHDAEVEDLSAAGRARDSAMLRRYQARLAGIATAGLSRDNQVDAALLTHELRYRLWSLETLQDWRWNPLAANGAISGGLYGLAARDFATWPVRLRAAIARMEQAPAQYAAMRASLDPARVPAIYAQTVAQQNPGTVQIAEGMLAPHKAELPAADQARFDNALAGLKAAVAEQQRWLDTVLVPQAKGDFRLGPALYDHKLALALNTRLTRAEIKARALKAAADTRAQMYAIARRVLPARAFPAQPTPAEQQTAIEAALDLTYATAPARDQVLPTTTAAIQQATAFVRAKGLVSVPEAPVGVIEMPKFRQGVAVAYCDSPGPLERELPTLVAVSPIPESWSDAQATSFLREYNRYMIQDLAVHEAMPGHYLQLAHANAATPLRAVLASGSFIEGWAVYAEQVMADAGYLADPLFELTVLKMRLRSITNTLLDIGVHTEGMTEAQAMELMTRGAFQQEREAAGKWTRARLSSVQLLNYFTGYTEHLDLRRAVEAREGRAFDLKRYNDAVLSHGSPPVRYVRALMLGEKIDL
jgi:uncharacterized protein (DUF885 family)